MGVKCSALLTYPGWLCQGKEALFFTKCRGISGVLLIFTLGTVITGLMMKNTHVINHPLLLHKLGILRDQKTSSQTFRDVLREISYALAYESLRDWARFRNQEIQTPIAPTTIQKLAEPPVIISVMRAGNGMLDGVLTMLPMSSVGFIGLYRDKAQHRIVEYACKLPAEIKGRDIILCDPLIASADSILAAIARIQEFSVGKIKVLSILASEQGLSKITTHYPDVQIYTLHVEEQMNSNGYLVPGLGDAGDRLYQTI